MLFFITLLVLSTARQVLAAEESPFDLFQKLASFSLRSNFGTTACATTECTPRELAKKLSTYSLANHSPSTEFPTPTKKIEEYAEKTVVQIYKKYFEGDELKTGFCMTHPHTEASLFFCQGRHIISCVETPSSLTLIIAQLSLNKESSLKLSLSKIYPCDSEIGLIATCSYCDNNTTEPLSYLWSYPVSPHNTKRTIVLENNGVREELFTYIQALNLQEPQIKSASFKSGISFVEIQLPITNNHPITLSAQSTQKLIPLIQYNSSKYSLCPRKETPLITPPLPANRVIASRSLTKVTRHPTLDGNTALSAHLSVIQDNFSTHIHILATEHNTWRADSARLLATCTYVISQINGETSKNVTKLYGIINPLGGTSTITITTNNYSSKGVDKADITFPATARTPRTTSQITVTTADCDDDPYAYCGEHRNMCCAIFVCHKKQLAIKASAYGLSFKTEDNRLAQTITYIPENTTSLQA